MKFSHFITLRIGISRTYKSSKAKAIVSLTVGLIGGPLSWAWFIPQNTTKPVDGSKRRERVFGRYREKPDLWPLTTILAEILYR